MPKSARQLLIDGGEDGDPVICVNEEYARRFEVMHSSICLLKVSSCCHALTNHHPWLQHNKRREELHRLQEKHPELAARLARKVCAEVMLKPYRQAKHIACYSRRCAGSLVAAGQRQAGTLGF